MKREEEQQTQPFAIVPTEVMMDTRLTLESMRVLVTLFSFRNKLTGLAFPSREAIAERCGMHPSNISAATTKLVELGWLAKDGKGGHSKATKYTITIPEVVAELATSHRAKSQARKDKKVAEQATVAQSATVAEQAIPTVVQSATRQVAQSATRKEQTNITNKVTDEKHNAATAAVVLPFDEGIFPEIADRRLVKDWVKVRKTKRLPITETGLEGFVNEVRKSGLTLEAALRICCENGWAGFRASWLHKTAETFSCVTEEMFDWAVRQGVPEEKVKAETDKFILTHRAKGNEFVDWIAAWKAWMVSAAGYAGVRK